MVYISDSRPFLSRGTLGKLYQYLAAPQYVEIGIKINELQLLAAPLAQSHGTLVCRTYFVNIKWPR